MKSFNYVLVLCASCLSAVGAFAAVESFSDVPDLKPEVMRVFGENDADFAEKRQQIVKHCALTNPVWLRTDAFRAPKPIPAPDPLTIREVRELEDFLLKGEFRFDPRVEKELEPGMVPVWAFQIDKVRAALERAANR